MPVQQLEANLRSLPNLAIIDLHGDIDGFAEPKLESTYTEAEALNPDTILLNFTDVEYVNLQISLLFFPMKTLPLKRCRVQVILKID